jgi:NADPH-dependent 2,4-dienoyl-CoA reductase/sulfur reductase-like enzyme
MAVPSAFPARGVEDGRVVSADMVVLAIGVRPNVALASEAGLTTGDDLLYGQGDVDLLDGGVGGADRGLNDGVDSLTGIEIVLT